jgi:hypothetical protein
MKILFYGRSGIKKNDEKRKDGKVDFKEMI